MKTFSLGPLSKDDLCAWLFALRGRAFCPLSHYAVAAIGRVQDIDGRDVYLAGVNVENDDHRLSTHAEEGVLSAMMTTMGAGARLAEIWAAAAPDHLQPGDDHPLAATSPSYCGKCRQQVAGLATGPDMKLHAVSLLGVIASARLDALLPGVMTMDNLGDNLGDGVPAAPEKRVAFDNNRLLRPAVSDKKILQDWLSQLTPHAPVSGAGRAVLLRFADGQVVAGVDIEDPAFLKISAFQSALANAAVCGIAFQSARVSAVYLQRGAAFLESDRQVLQRVIAPGVTPEFL